jgi:CubicO group peptidase (beta-lactamase class C family)
MARILILLLLCLGFAGPQPAKEHSDATIAQHSQELLERMVPRGDGAGAVLLVARGSDVIYRGARGRANVELAVPLAPDHVFRIASVTKIFTAAMVLRPASPQALADLEAHFSSTT